MKYGRLRGRVRKKENLFILNRRRRRRMREKENNNIKKMPKGEGQCRRGRRKNFLVALASINHSATWNRGKSGRKKKCPLHFTLKRVKVYFF
jgi:hypothetical protein